jgi:metallo-beta-lactamase family protein
VKTQRLPGRKGLSSWRRAVLCCLGVLLCASAPPPLIAAPPSRLSETSYGAAGVVTGSLHVLDTGNGRWMIDCGSLLESNHAGPNADEAPGEGPAGEGAVQMLPPGIESVSGLFVTHAHADHLGRVPLLAERGFSGPIYMTEATAALAVPMLRVLLRMDRGSVRDWVWSKGSQRVAENGHKSLYVHWRDCKYRREIAEANVERATGSTQELFDRFAHKTPRLKVALCSECVAEQIAAVLRHVRAVKYGEAVDVAPGVRVTFLDAGHIPGSASILFEVALAEKLRRVLFSGDLGNGLSPLMTPLQPAPDVDAVFVEATYGPISRKAVVREQRPLFRQAVADSVARGGVTWIPCYALDRTQKILYELHLAQQEKRLVGSLPIYCPSPTAKEVTALYREHLGDGWFPPTIAADRDAFSPREIHTTVPSETRLPRPCIIVSTGDLVVSAWMRHLLTRLLPEPSTTIILVAYQPQGSAGERLLHGAATLEIDGQPIPVRAGVHSFSCFSGHADASEIDAWLAHVSKQATVVLIHGDPEELGQRAEQLRRQGRQKVRIARPDTLLDLTP